MLLTDVTLANVRNYAMLEFAPQPGLNVFIGANAQGKSNLLEAIAMLGTGRSFRTARDGEIIAAGMPTASISGIAQTTAGSVRLACTLGMVGTSVRKRYTLNGENVKYASFLGRARIVTFVPNDLQLVTGAPAQRRTFLNATLSQENPAYYLALAAYTKCLAQKSALLRGTIAPDEDLIATYDEQLIAAGTRLIRARKHYVRALAEAARSIQGAWMNRVGATEDLQIMYVPNVACEETTEDAIAAAFREALRRERSRERMRKVCLVGPHRDDLALRLGDVALAAFGSQGQMRTAVLALKVAEYRVLHARSGDAPILLLDDVLSELDERRAEAFLAAIGSCEQAFLTTTGLARGTGQAHVFTIVHATVKHA